MTTTTETVSMALQCAVNHAAALAEMGWLVGQVTWTQRGWQFRVTAPVRQIRSFDQRGTMTIAKEGV